MIDREEYCDDVLTQIAAVQSAMSAVAKIIMENHVRTCVANRLAQGDETVIDEFVQTLGRMK